MFLIKKVLTALILPPNGPILLALFGLWLASKKSRRWHHGGIALILVALAALLIMSVPLIGKSLLASREVFSPITQAQLAQAQALVVLGGGSYRNAPEYSGYTVSNGTLERLRYAARLARESGLPLLLTGGAPFGGKPEAESMKEVLEDDFGQVVRWTEIQSRDTAENASHSAPILKDAGITRIALISHAWHLPRAVQLFEREGFQVTAAPTAFITASPSLLEDLLPGDGLSFSRQALHEYLAQLAHQLTGKS
jgi:uncharacterized SAM-binding protein YcdF (DUF218 family)